MEKQLLALSRKTKGLIDEALRSREKHYRSLIISFFGGACLNIIIEFNFLIINY